MSRDVISLLFGVLAGLAAVVAVMAAAAWEVPREEIDQISRCDDDDPANRGAGDCTIAISPA